MPQSAHFSTPMGTREIGTWAFSPTQFQQHTCCKLSCCFLAFFNHQRHSHGTYMNGKHSPNKTSHSTPLVAPLIKAVRESSVTCALPDKCGIPSQPHYFGSTFFRLLSTLFRLFCHFLAFFNHHSHSRRTYMNGKCSPNRTCYSH